MRQIAVQFLPAHRCANWHVGQGKIPPSGYNPDACQWVQFRIAHGRLPKGSTLTTIALIKGLDASTKLKMAALTLIRELFQGCWEETHNEIPVLFEDGLPGLRVPALQGAKLCPSLSSTHTHNIASPISPNSSAPELTHTNTHTEIDQTSQPLERESVGWRGEEGKKASERLGEGGGRKAGEIYK